MPRGNVDNLKLIRTTEEARERGRNGGKASGKVRAQQKTLKAALKLALDLNVEFDGKSMDSRSAMAVAMIREAMGGNVKAFVAIRDTIGELPKQEVEHSGEVGVRYEDFLRKVNKNDEL